MESEDHNLIEQLRTTEKRDQAFYTLVNQYKERLYWHIRKIVISHEDTDDVLQNTFIKAWKGLENFREESSLFTWLFRIATNESLTFMTSAKKRNFVALNEAGNFLEKKLLTDPYFEGDQLQLKLQQAILQLPDKQRIVFNMRYFDELKYEDMAEILDTSVGALKASYHHAAKKIEDFFKNQV